MPRRQPTSRRSATPTGRSLTSAAGLFETYTVDISSPTRKRLLDLLGYAGVLRAIRAATDGHTSGPAMADQLMTLSGFADLNDALAGLRSRVHVIRTARMLTDAEKIGYSDWEAGAPLRDAVEALRARPELHVLEETTVIDELRSGRTRLPADVVTDAVGILAGTNVPTDLAAAIDRWREIETLAGDPHAERAARTVVRSLTIRRKADR